MRGREGGKGRGRGRDAERKEGGGGEMQRGRREGKERVHTLAWVVWVVNEPDTG